MGSPRNANRYPSKYINKVTSYVLTEYVGKSVPKLSEFCVRVAQEIPGIKFAPIGDRKVVGSFTGDPYVSMELEVDEFYQKYSIYSRNIKNNKHRCDKLEFYSAQAGDLNAAVKMVNKNFRRMLPEEAATMEHGRVSNSAAKYVQDMMTEQSNALSNMYRSPAFIPYMRALVQNDTPSEAITKDVVAQAGALIQATDNLLEIKGLHSRWLYIQVSSGDVNTYSVVPYDKNTTSVSAARMVVYGEDNLGSQCPGALEKIAMLAMTDLETFVSGVGMRTHENVFWVTQ